MTPQLPAMRTVSFALACVIAMLPVCASAQTGAEPVAASPTPLDAPLPEARFSSRLILTDAEDIAKIHTSRPMQRFSSAAAFEAALRAPLRPDSRASELDEPDAVVEIEEGEFAGRWRFERGADGTLVRAWRDIDHVARGVPGEMQTYVAERWGYCSESRSACEAWFERGRHRAAKPRNTMAAIAHLQWRERTLQETCTPGPKFRPPLDAIERAIARSGLTTATVVLRLVLNPCGDVRDADIETGSGDSAIDRMFVAWALRSRMPLGPRPAGRGAIGRLPISLKAVDIPAMPIGESPSP